MKQKDTPESVVQQIRLNKTKQKYLIYKTELFQ
jgi:hypothetical protein